MAHLFIFTRLLTIYLRLAVSTLHPVLCEPAVSFCEVKKLRTNSIPQVDFIVSFFFDFLRFFFLKLGLTKLRKFVLIKSDFVSFLTLG